MNKALIQLFGILLLIGVFCINAHAQTIYDSYDNNGNRTPYQLS